MKNLSLLVILFISYTINAQTEIDFYTNMGDFRVEVREDLMPITAGNFIDLVEAGFYDGVIFHRVVSGFVIQGGDPTGTGFGGPGYTIMDEYHPDMNHDSTGVIAMAKTPAPNSAGSQFYFTIGAQSFLDGDYAAFGSCIQNVQVIEDISLVAVDGSDRPLVDVVMDSLRIVQVTTTGIKDIENIIKTEVFPNPFTGVVHINYEVKTPGKITLNIYDLQGRLVQTLLDGMSSVGIHYIEWDGKNLNQTNVSPGTYYLSLVTPRGVGVQKLIKNY